MRRILSAITLLPLVFGTVYFLPAVATLVLAEVAVFFAAIEYVGLVGRIGVRLPKAVVVASVMAVCASVGQPGSATEVTLIAAMVVVGAQAVALGRSTPQVLNQIAISCFALIYIGLTVGTLVSVRGQYGREALLVLLLTIMVSDIVQYYGGRLLGRRPLAPVISPKKTIEGAVSGLIAGVFVTLLLGNIWLPLWSTLTLVLLGITVVALGVIGDLFESLIKRSVGVKDSSGLIPGHGGILDRLDSLLFAAPGYYVFLYQLS